MIPLRTVGSGETYAARQPKQQRKRHPFSALAGMPGLVPALALVLLLLAALPLHAQGCAQCLDSTRATPPAVQAAYRHAIYLLGGVATGFFLSTLFLLRRHR